MIFYSAKNDFIFIRIHHFEFVLDFVLRVPVGAQFFFLESQTSIWESETLILESRKTLPWYFVFGGTQP